MKTLCTAIISWLFVFSSSSLLFAQAELFNKKEPITNSSILFLSSFFIDTRDPAMVNRLFNSRVNYARRDEKKDREKLREQWEEFLGVDVFYPYFKAKEIEKSVQERTKVEFFNFKGRAEFDEGNSSSFRYIFKKKF